MSQIIQTYHPTEDNSRGIHAFTTSDPFEALALQNALTLLRLLGGFLCWSNLIEEAVAEVHGEQKITQLIRNELAQIDAIYRQAGGK